MLPSIVCYPVRICIWGHDGEMCDKDAYVEINLPIVPRVGDLVTIPQDKKMELLEKMYAKKSDYCQFCNVIGTEMIGGMSFNTYDIEGTTKESFINNVNQSAHPLHFSPVVHVQVDGVENCVWVVIHEDLQEWNDNSVIVQLLNDIHRDMRRNSLR